MSTIVKPPSAHGFPDFITYRFRDILVYVSPHAEYHAALDIAIKEFPELASIPRNRISFNTLATFTSRGETRAVRISESAWPAAVARQLRGAILDILVAPDPNAKEEEKDLAPPQYLEIPVSIERKSRSTPSSPASSRHPSPSPLRSQKSSRRSWLGI